MPLSRVDLDKYKKEHPRKYKTAENISTFTNPPIICIPLFLIICFYLSSSFNPSFSVDWGKFIVLEGISLVFISILPMAIILFWAKKLNTDKDISNRSDRYVPLLVGVVSYFIGFLVALALHLDWFLTILILCYAIDTFIVMLITTQWKVSIHTTGLSGPVAALIVLLGPIGALFGLIYPVLIWSRVLLKKHSLAQAIVGGAQGFFLTCFWLYLFIGLFNLPVVKIYTPIESAWFILAIILYPILLGTSCYLNRDDNSAYKAIFAVIGAVALFIFMFYAPVDALIIFILEAIISVSIFYFESDVFLMED